jgi:putative membrane protein
MKTRFFLMSILILTSVVACRKDKKLNDTDENFLMKAAAANYNEIDAGQLAATRATDPAVQSFANMMVSEHQTALNELKTIAADEEVTLPTGPDQAHVAAKQQLMLLSGRAFDSTYIHMQVTDHQATINLFQDEIDNGQHKKVQDYSDKYMPHIRTHLNMADTISDRF